MKNVILTISTIALLSLSVYSFVKKHNKYTENQLLVDYYRKTQHADGFSSYELALYATKDITKVRLETYTKEDGMEETSTSTILPFAVINECMQWINKCKMHTWNAKSSTMSQDGTKLVCKYVYHDKYICVSTDCMPANGDQMIQEIANIISKYAGKHDN